MFNSALFWFVLILWLVCLIFWITNDIWQRCFNLKHNYQELIASDLDEENNSRGISDHVSFKSDESENSEDDIDRIGWRKKKQKTTIWFSKT